MNSTTRGLIEFIENVNKWKHDINYKENPLKYEVTDDCGGMYICEPYKTRLLGIWKFSTPSASKTSAKDIKSMFLEYLNEGDFVGADLAKKYLRAGTTRRSVPTNSKKHFVIAYREIKNNLKYLSLKKIFLEKKEQRQREYAKR